MSADSIMDAVGYLLNRCQTDPDLGYLMWGTEAWALLTAAEAAHLGRDVAAHREARSQDRQPEYRRCEARAVVAAAASTSPTSSSTSLGRRSTGWAAAAG